MARLEASINQIKRTLGLRATAGMGNKSGGRFGAAAAGEF